LFQSLILFFSSFLVWLATVRVEYLAGGTVLEDGGGVAFPGSGWDGMVRDRGGEGRCFWWP